MTLNTRIIGSGPRVVLVHGFTQNLNCWGPFAEALAERHEVVMVDAPGHGESHHDNADHWEAGRLLLEAGGGGVYIGYSMGGRLALHAALQSPDLVKGLVLIGAHPGIESDSDRDERRRSDESRADQIANQGLDKFVDAWLSNPMFAELDDSNKFRAQRLMNRPEGLIGSMTNSGTGSQEPLWDQLDRLRMPVLYLAGENDHKFTKIGLKTLDAIGPAASLSIEAGCGHAPHLERPQPIAKAISAFVNDEVLEP